MKLKSTVLMLVMMSALILATFNEGPVVSQVIDPPIVPCPDGPYEKFGPRVDRLIFRVSGDVSTECDEFEAGLIDVMDWAAPAERWNQWLEDPEITMGTFGEFAPIYLALNTMRWPLGHGDQLPYGWTGYPTGYLSNHNLSLWNGDSASSDLPAGTADMTYIDYECQRCLDSRLFRQGLAHIVDRAGQVERMARAGVKLEPSLYVPALKVWENPLTPTYAYDLTAAAACFEAGGFKDWDGDKKLEYSPDHTGAVVEELPIMQFYTRQDDAHRILAGQYISKDMDLLGVPHSLIIATYGTVSSEVWAKYNYDIYIEYWDWGPTPDIYSEWFASSADIYPEPWGNNEHRYHSKELDPWAKLFTTASDAEEAKPYCYKMQEIVHRDVPAIPYYCYSGYNAHRTHYGTWPADEKYKDKLWEGMCNYPGEGFYTWSGQWTPLNSHPKGFDKGGTLRQGLNIDAEVLDVMDAIYFYDGLVLNQIYESLVKFNPFDLTKYIPWLCDSYTVGTWQHPTEGTCSAINFTLIPGILWQDGTPMTAEDVGFSFQFTKDCKSVAYMYVKDFAGYKTYPNTPEPGRETIEIRFKIKSWMALSWCGIGIIPKHVWAAVGAKGSASYLPEDHDTVFGTGPFRFYKDGVVGRVNRVPGEYLYLEPNPLYFRKYIWPDVCNATDMEPGKLDEEVDLADFMVVAMPGHIFAREDFYGQWATPKPGAWGEPCDVNKDGKIGVGDLMEIGVHFAELWPPSWYVW